MQATLQACKLGTMRSKGLLGLLNRPPLRHKNAKDIHIVIIWSIQEAKVKRPELSSQAASSGYFALLLGPFLTSLSS